MATVKEPVNVPSETWQVDSVTGVPVSEQLVSLVEKPEPETVTVEPTEAETGLRRMDNVSPV